MADKYKVQSTTPTVYLDKSNKTVQGYIVYVDLLDYNELHEIRVPALDEKTVKVAIDKLVSDRDKLANL